MSLDGLSINLATVREQWDMRQAVDACLQARHHRDRAVARPGREDRARGGGAHRARQRPARHRPLPRRHVPGARRGRPRSARSTTTSAPSTRRRRSAPTAWCWSSAACRKARATSRRTRDMVRDGIAAVLPHARASKMPLAIEPLHPMYAADRACVNTLEQALDLCDALGDGVGVAIDTYHVWWDPELFAADRARRPRQAHPRASHLRLAGADARTCCSTAA